MKIQKLLYSGVPVLGIAFSMSTSIGRGNEPVANNDSDLVTHSVDASLSQQLALTASQRQQIIAIILDHRAKSKALFANSALSSAETQRQIKSLHHDSLVQTLAILTTQQKTAFFALNFKGL